MPPSKKKLAKLAEVPQPLDESIVEKKPRLSLLLQGFDEVTTGLHASTTHNNAIGKEQQLLDQSVYNTDTKYGLQDGLVKNEVKAETIADTTLVEYKPALSATTTPPESPQWHPLMGRDDPEAVFFFSDHVVKHSPSFRTHQIPPEEERRLRIIGTTFVRHLADKINYNDLRSENEGPLPEYVEALLRGEELKNPFVSNEDTFITMKAIHTAMIYVNRFYMFHSLGTFDPRHIAAAALLLACKVNYCFVKARMIGVWLYFELNPEDLQKDQSLFNDNELKLVVTVILRMEIQLLKTFGLVSKVELPIEVIAKKGIFLRPNFELVREAYVICGEILQYTTLVLRYRAGQLGATAVLLAGVKLGIDLDQTYDNDWYLKIDLTVTPDMMVAIGKEFCEARAEINFFKPNIATPFLSELVDKEVKISMLPIMSHPKANLQRPTDEKDNSAQYRRRNPGQGDNNPDVKDETTFHIENYEKSDVDDWKRRRETLQKFRESVQKLWAEHPEAGLHLYPTGIRML